MREYPLKRCLYCGKEFEDKTYNKIKLFCNNKCRDKYQYHFKGRKEKNKEYNKKYYSRPNVIQRKKEYLKQYRAKNKDKIKAREKKYNLEHRDHKLVLIREWHKTHKEQEKAKAKQYYQKHQERLKAYTRHYYNQHKEKILTKLQTPEERIKRRKYEQQYITKNRFKRKAYMKEYYQRPEIKEHRRIKQLNSRHKKPEEVREKARKYRAIPEVKERYKSHFRKFRHSEKGLKGARYHNQTRRERKLGVREEYTKQEYLELLNQTNGICPICKEPFLKNHLNIHEPTVDHILPLSKVPKGFVYTIKDLRIICRGCNSKKGNRVFQKQNPLKT